MWSDVVDLRDFYASPRGQVAQRMVRAQISQLWPDLSGQRLLGIGYATPFLGGLGREAERTLAVMPAGQGVLHWPVTGGGRVALSDEAELPFADNSIDRIVVAHALEFSEQWRPMMREIWRVLAGGGRLIVIVPNRRGLWAQFERTPFGRGQAYSRDQLVRLLRETLFTPFQVYPALYVPPASSRMVLASASAWERLGRRWFARLAGVFVVEAGKQLYAGDALGRVAPAQRRVYRPAVTRP